jgi:N-acylneuraminate cytidylyltransferase
MIKNNQKVLAIIPARGGSKGIPRKNIQKLAGKPLIAYSIEAALNAKLIDRVIVSTDDEEIAAVSREYGADVPFLRPREMAQDNSSINEALSYTLKQLQDNGENFFARIILYPTHPFRTPQLLDFLSSKLLDGYSPVYTHRKIIFPKSGFYVSESLNNPLFLKPLPKQPIHEENRYFFRNYGTFLGYSNHGGKQYIHILDDPISLIDIDTWPDFHLAEIVIQKGLFDFNYGSQINVCQALYN